jgi:3-hydroxymyristoyl/3-hydroxydecanoyl-(acyl carrier protein) dehydratase
VDRGADGSVVVRLTASAVWSRDAAAWPAVLAIEILAQAAAVVLAEGPGAASLEGGRGWLAGVDEARFERPLSAGGTLRASFAVEGRFRRMVKARGELRDERSGETVATAGLLLAMDR